jgi:hypothetical protein
MRCRRHWKVCSIAATISGAAWWRLRTCRQVGVAVRARRREFRADGLTEAIYSIAVLASWIDLPDSPGIYVVYWAQSLAPEFQVSAGKAISANCARPSYLEQKWQFTCQKAATDIIYIGKGDNLRRRIRLLARFGVGKANNHAGGEWIWQIQEIETARLLVQTCPPGQQQGFENWLLEFHGGDSK